jgi:hypothetical protein
MLPARSSAAAGAAALPHAPWLWLQLPAPAGSDRAASLRAFFPRLQFKEAHLLERATGGAAHLQVSTNEKADTPLPYLPPFPHPRAAEGRSTYACIFNLLFRPSPALQAAFDEQQQQMFGRALGPGEGYAAVHLRLGKLTGEEQPISALLYGDTFEDPLTHVSRSSAGCWLLLEQAAHTYLCPGRPSASC